jgi:hypothetical protein
VSRRMEHKLRRRKHVSDTNPYPPLRREMPEQW